MACYMYSLSHKYSNAPPTSRSPVFIPMEVGDANFVLGLSKPGLLQTYNISLNVL